MERDELAAWLRLALTPGVGDAAARRLLAAFGLPQAIFDQPHARSDGRGRARPTPPPCSRNRRGWPHASCDATLAWLAQATTAAATPRADTGRCRLSGGAAADRRPAADAVSWLGRPVCGTGRTGMAVVGSRNPTPQGSCKHAKLRPVPCRRRLHGGLRARPGRRRRGPRGRAARLQPPDALATIAVVGTGLDRVYPRQHHALAHRIAAARPAGQRIPARHAAAGAELSPPQPPHRGARARARWWSKRRFKSGSLITARLAAEQGKEVFAIPGSIHSPQARGCHCAAQAGRQAGGNRAGRAGRARHAPAPPCRSTSRRRPKKPLETPEDDPLLRALGFDPVGLDALVARTGIAPHGSRQDARTGTRGPGGAAAGRPVPAAGRGLAARAPTSARNTGDANTGPGCTGFCAILGPCLKCWCSCTKTTGEAMPAPKRSNWDASSAPTVSSPRNPGCAGLARRPAMSQRKAPSCRPRPPGLSSRRHLRARSPPACASTRSPSRTTSAPNASASLLSSNLGRVARRHARRS